MLRARSRSPETPRRLGDEIEGVALGPNIAALLGNLQRLLAMVQRLLCQPLGRRRPGLAPGKASAAPRDQSVRLLKPVPARPGDVERLLGMRERLLPRPVPPPEIRQCNENVREVSHLPPAAEESFKRC